MVAHVGLCRLPLGTRSWGDTPWTALCLLFCPVMDQTAAQLVQFAGRDNWELWLGGCCLPFGQQGTLRQQACMLSLFICVVVAAGTHMVPLDGVKCPAAGVLLHSATPLKWIRKRLLLLL